MKKKRLLIYFYICLALFTLMGIAVFYLAKLNISENYNDRVDHTYNVIIQMHKLEKHLLDAETGQRGFIITRDSAYLSPYFESNGKILKVFLELDTLTAASGQQKRQLDTLKSLILTNLHLLEDNMSRMMTDTTFKEQFEKGNYYMEKIRKSMNNLKHEEVMLLNERNAHKRSNSASSKTSSYILLTIGFAACCLGSIAIVKFFNRSYTYQRQLANNLFKLKVLNKEIIDLTYASTHNLQEPMRKIQLIIDKLQHNKESDEMQFHENLQRIKLIYAEQQATNNAIVDYFDILNKTGKKEILSLKEMVHKVAARKAADHSFELTTGEIPEIYASYSQIFLLFDKLIENSIDFKNPSDKLHIDIREIPADQFIKGIPDLQSRPHFAIAISDNGSGVENIYHHKIFDLFQKIDSIQKSKGKGMGLSFAKRIMLNHNGWIMAQNNTPNGLTIILFFPK